MDAERAAREFESLDGLERWGDLPAVQRRETYVVDSGSLFSRSGPRLVDGLEVLGQILHSELFPEALPREAAIRVESMVG
jgi:iron complex transport system substrate-binding protein